MKKIFAFAIAAVTMTVGCQKIQELVNPDRNQTSFDDNEPVEITFNTNVANVATKAAIAGENTLEGKTVYVYGFNNSTDQQEFYNEKATVGTLTAGKMGLTMGNTHFYNGTTDRYSFYGYYVDDACLDTDGNVIDPVPSETDYTLAVTIDGSQDLLLAKTNPAEDVKDKSYDGAGAQPVSKDDVYSAKTARAGVVPNLVFEHALAKFNFSVINKGGYDLTLENLAVSSMTKGTLTVAEDNQGLKATTGSDGYLYLPLAGGSMTLPQAPVPTTPIPGEIMAFALYAADGTQDNGVDVRDVEDNKNTAETSDDVTYKVSNDVTFILKQDGMEGKRRVVTMPIRVTTPEVDGLRAALNGTVAGYQYNVSIIVYSLEQISLTATVTPWKEVTAIEINPDDTNSNVEDGMTYITAEAVEDKDAATPTTLTFDVTVGKDTKSFKYICKEASAAAPTTEEWAAESVKSQAVTAPTFDYSITIDKLAAKQSYKLYVQPVGTMLGDTWYGDVVVTDVATTPAFILDVYEKEVEAAATNVVVTVTAGAGIMVNAEIPTAATWVKETHAENVYTFAVEENEGEERSAIITFGDGSTTKTVTITQKAAVTVEP